MGAQEWMDDLEPAGDNDEDDEDAGSSLFEENFEKMLEDDDLDSLTIDTLGDQVDRIDNVEILEAAAEQDSRKGATKVYNDRIDEIEADDGDDDSDDAVDVGDEEELAEVSDEETGSADGSDGVSPDDGDGDDDEGDEDGDVLNDLVGDEPEEDEPSDDPEDLGEPETHETTKAAEETEDEAELEEAELSEATQEEAQELMEEMDMAEDATEASAEETETEEDPEASADPEPAEVSDSGPEEDTSDLPDVDVGSLAPSAISRDDAVEAEKQRTMLVWGPEGAGKSHIAHSAPEPIAYIDTEGKANELADKFDKEIQYWECDNYKEAKNALDEALDLLDAYLDAGVRGTLVVDSMTAMWEYAKVDYAKFAYQTDDLSEVNFQSELEGEKDWTKIKARHNEEFRETILNAPFHVVFTSGQKEDYNGVFEGDGKAWVPDGEKWNKYAVKDVVQLRRDGRGRTVADLRKAAKTRYSFTGLLWPDFDSVYQAVDSIYDAEQAPQPVDVDDWEFGVVDGQPVGESPGGSDDSDDDGGDE